MTFDINILRKSLHDILRDRNNLNQFFNTYQKKLKQFKIIDLKKQKWKNLEDINKDNNIKENVFIRGDLQTREAGDNHHQRYNSGIIIVKKNNQMSQNELIFSDIHADYSDLENIFAVVLKHLENGGVVVNCGDSILELSSAHRKTPQCQPFKTALALLLLQAQYPRQFICLAGNHDREDCINGFKTTKKALNAAICGEYIKYYIYPQLLLQQLNELVSHKKYKQNDLKIISENLEISLEAIIAKEPTLFEKFISSQSSEINDLCGAQVAGLQINNEQKKYLHEALQAQINIRRIFTTQYRDIYDPPKNKSKNIQQNITQKMQNIINELLDNFKKDKEVFYKLIDQFPEIAISPNTKTLYVHASIPKVTANTKFTEILNSAAIEDIAPGNIVTLFPPDFHVEYWKNFKQFGFDCCCKGHNHGNMLNGAEVFSKENKLQFVHINDINTVFSCSAPYNLYKQCIQQQESVNKLEKKEKNKEKQEEIFINNKKNDFLFFPPIKNFNISNASISASTNSTTNTFTTNTTSSSLDNYGNNKSLQLPMSSIVGICGENYVNFPCVMSNDLLEKKFIPLDPQADELAYWCKNERCTEVKELVMSWQSKIEKSQYVNRISDKIGMNALHIACKNGNSTIINFLLSVNADPNIASKFRGLYPLHFAAMSDDVTIMNTLLDNPCIKLNVQDSATKATPLHFCLNIGNFPGAKALLNSKHEIIVELNDSNNKTSLDLLNETDKMKNNTEEDKKNIGEIRLLIENRIKNQNQNQNQSYNSSAMK